MNNPHAGLPYYEIPLTPAQIADLGRFTAVFSQLDFLLGQCIALIARSPTLLIFNLLDGASSGGKLAALRKVAEQHEDKRIKKAVKDIADDMGRLLDKRNHIVHGSWVQHVFVSEKKVRAACYFPRNKRPIKAADLTRLADDGADLTRKVGYLIETLESVKTTPWTGPKRMFITTEDLDLANIPDWLGGPIELLRTDYPPQPEKQ